VITLEMSEETATVLAYCIGTALSLHVGAAIDYLAAGGVTSEGLDSLCRVYEEIVECVTGCSVYPSGEDVADWLGGQG